MGIAVLLSALAARTFAAGRTICTAAMPFLADHLRPLGHCVRTYTLVKSVRKLEMPWPPNGPQTPQVAQPARLVSIRRVGA